MKVIKIEKALLAFAFFVAANDTGTNFAELEAEVKAEGGTIEKVANDLVIIKVGGTDYTLPLNFAVVINGGVGKVVSKEVFEAEYASVIGDDGFDLDGLVERVAKLETYFAAKSDSKPRANKGTYKEKDND